ncbi:MAG: biosynthetic-type acetolactate synthase large subunit [Acidaminococcales bacterium]|jgi:acetolactate synthase-1/2/3 large subunit|nr:biosynthetic-type acetolactate synthase large subunit [Acidaminococcales bacterium]
MKITGAQVIVNILLEQGVDTVFGYPGGQVIPLYDALYDAPLRKVLPVHEQGAIHAADGYARVSGRTGVCIVTSGPGATNIVTGLATAYLDSIPLVVICGQVPTPQIGRDSFQEVDIVSVSLAVTKYSAVVLRPEDLAGTLREAFAVARSGRMAPVLIDIPSDIQRALIDWDEEGNAAEMDIEEEDLPFDLSAVKAAAGLICRAERPVLMVGGGAIQAGCSWAIRELAGKTGMPVVSTLMGLGAFPGSHPQFLGMSGMHGQKAANLAVSNSDVIVVVGSRFSERVTGDRSRYVKSKKIIQFDIDPSEMDKNVTVALPIVANLSNSMAALAAEVEVRPDISRWWEQIAKWREEHAYSDEGDFNPYWILREINKAFQDEEVIFVTDVGQNQMWAAQALCIMEPRTHITSGGSGTMGFSMPAAVGAQIAKPRARVVQIAGDGGFKMTGMELFTAVNEKLPIISIVLNNHVLGMVKQWQELFFNKRFSSTLLEYFDFVKFADSCGAKGRKAGSREEFLAALVEAKAARQPFLLELSICPDAMVKPMVAPGAAIDEFVEFKAGK